MTYDDGGACLCDDCGNEGMVGCGRGGGSVVGRDVNDAGRFGSGFPFNRMRCPGLPMPRGARCSG